MSGPSPLVSLGVLDMVARFLVITDNVHIVAGGTSAVGRVGGVFRKASAHDWNALCIIVDNGPFGPILVCVDVGYIAIRGNASLVLVAVLFRVCPGGDREDSCW
jgi:hypothetical protein